MGMEILSPAGSMEGVIAAVRAGADAVYFGGGDFNARRNAKNLSEQELAEAIKYCRLRGVRTFLTLNTLLTDREIPRAAALVEKLTDMGADALIVQDIGMAAVVRRVSPGMPIHASTQMTIHSLAGVMEAAEMGFSRVVLARELPLGEIEGICARSPIEIEIFCHGALCMCYSGQCYMSAMIGGRSGNRGLCAQPCRMAYSYAGEKPGYPLSLKDLSIAGSLKEVEQAGVKCVKIEGRMKRPEYTALVTKVYKDALTFGRLPSREEMLSLEALFSRQGFTNGYMLEEKGEGMFGVREEGTGRETRSLYKQARAIYETTPEPPHIGISFSFSGRSGERLKLEAVDQDGRAYYAEGPVPEKAVNRPTSEEDVESSLRKTGGTVFFPVSVNVRLEDGLRISAATLNAMRRQCTDGLEAVRKTPPRRPTAPYVPRESVPGWKGKPAMVYSFRSFTQILPAMLRLSPEYVSLPLQEIDRHPKALDLILEHGIRVAAALPRVAFDREWGDMLAALRRAKRAGVTSLYVGNIGYPAFLRELGFELRGDFGLNVMNSESIDALKRAGLSSATVSFEMTLPQIRDLSYSIPGEMIAYGRLPLMITENCLLRRPDGSGCPCGGGAVTISDRTGRSFPILREEGCRSGIYNSEPLYLADRLADLRGLGPRWLRLMFTTENPRECLRVAASYAELAPDVPEGITRGLYYRGVQ